MRYCGKLGFADEVEETAPSVFTEKMTERTYYGDVLEFGRQMQMGDKVNPDITVGNQLSVLAAGDFLRSDFAVLHTCYELGRRSFR